MKKYWKAITLIVTLLMLITACGNTKNADDGGNTKKADKSNTSTNSDEDIELRISWWGSEARHNATLEVISMFEEENPNIKIKPEYSGYAGYQDKLVAQIISRTAPDIFTCVSEWIPDLKASDGLADLNDRIDVSGHNEKLVEACSLNGEMLGINLGVGVRGLMANATILESLGVENFQDGYTWDDLKAKLVEVYEASDGQVYGMSDASVDGMAWDVFRSSYGFTKLNKDDPFPAGQDSYNITKEDLIDWWTFWGDLRAVGAVAPPEIAAINDDGANSIFIKGQIAYEIINTAGLSKYSEQTKDELEIMHTPRSAEGETGELARPPMVFSVFKYSKNQEAAIKFLDYFTNNVDVVEALGTVRGILPTEVQRNALTNTEGILSESDQKVIEMVNEEVKMELNTMAPEPKGAGELKGIFQTIGQEVAFGKKTVDEAADAFLAETAKLFKNQ